MRDVPIDGDMIRLGQFLKLADLIDTGGEGKILISSGDVEVNGEVDLRRGRQLHRGDVVTVLGRTRAGGLKAPPDSLMDSDGGPSYFDAHLSKASIERLT